MNLFIDRRCFHLRVLSKISDVVYSIEKVLALILALTLMVSMVGGFFFRYVFKNPLLWSDELAIFCLIWITFIGGSMVLKEKASPAITILVDAVPDKYKKYIHAISNLILLIFVAYVLYLASDWIMKPNIFVQKSTALNWPKIYFYLSIPVSFAFATVHVINNTIQSFRQSEKDGGAFQSSR